MLAELSTQKYKGCSGKVAGGFSLLFFREEKGLFVLFVCLLRRDSTRGAGGRGGLEIVHEKEHEMCPRVCSTSSPTKIRAWLRFSRLCLNAFSKLKAALRGVKWGERLSHRNHHLISLDTQVP